MSLSHLVQTLGLTVLHMLWIGALIGGMAFVWLRSNQAADPRARYACAVGGLMALLVGTGLTFAFLASTSTTPIAFLVDTAGPSTTDGLQLPVETASLQRNFDRGTTGLGRATTSMIAWGWITGIALMSVRLFRQWIGVRRLRVVGIAEPSADWIRAFDTLKSKIGIHPRISMLVSHTIDAPMVVGWLRPLVLVPATAFTSLTPDQLQTILAHELQHIARRDHLVNMLQAFIEVLLFFHPVTWWLSRQIRVERENCCDDGALLVTGSPRGFAEALLVLESLRSDDTPSHQLLTATGGSLMHRVSRLFGSSQPQPLHAGWRTISACTLLAIAGLAFATATIAPTAVAQDRGVADAKQIDLDELKTNIEERIRAMGIDLRKKVAAGEISAEDAKARFDKGEERMWMRYKAAEEKNADASKAGGKNDQIDLDELKTNIEERIRAMGIDLRKQVAAGEISAEDAKARFDEGEKRMWMRYRAAEEKNADAMKARAKNDQIDLDELKAGIEERIRAMGIDLRKKVAAGEISAEDAKARFDKGEERMWMRYKAAEEKNAFAMKGDAKTPQIDLDELKAGIEERIRAMGIDLRKKVAAGEISAEDAKTRFDKGEERMWMRYRAAEEKNAFAMKGDAKTPQIDLDELKTGIEARIKAMGIDLRKKVAAGEMSEEDAKARFKKGEERMWMRYEAAEQKNADAMKAGKAGMSKADYDAAVRKMTEMVKAGKITREQMQKRLDRMKQADD
jgi:beta-lactamase regulating signal transducer with metallopeptidase domain/kynurenine formamidase